MYDICKDTGTMSGLHSYMISGPDSLSKLIDIANIGEVRFPLESTIRERRVNSFGLINKVLFWEGNQQKMESKK